MHKFVRNLLTEWRTLELPFDDETILIAVSGGADSVALALALCDLREAKKLKLNFVVAHFNHNLRGAESDADAEFVAQLAEKLNFKFVCKIQNPKSEIQNQKGNLEQNARRARYKFLFETAEKFNAFAVLTAHTANDQAETLLLNLLRGSGIEGLGAMRTIRPLGEREKGGWGDEETTSEEISFSLSPRLPIPPSPILLVRPLLGWAKRAETENFVRERKFDFRRDSMNADENFSRVKARKKLIPFLEREFNPKIIETLARTAFLLQQDAEQLSVISYRLSGELFVGELKNLTKSMLYRVLREWLKMIRGDLRQIDARHVKAIEQLIFSRKSGREIELPNGGAVIKSGGKIFFEKSKVEKSRSDN
ncbi:MAG: tRNA lysidine(34) synthetase TilS [Pyrinomonadaceae bacterium]